MVSDKKTRVHVDWTSHIISFHIQTCCFRLHEFHTLCKFCRPLRCRFTSGRTYLTPWGNTGYTFVRVGNMLSSRSVLLILLASICNLKWVLEQPRNSFLEDLPRFQWLWGVVKAWVPTNQDTNDWGIYGIKGFINTPRKQDPLQLFYFHGSHVVYCQVSMGRHPYSFHVLFLLRCIQGTYILYSIHCVYIYMYIYI